MAVEAFEAGGKGRNKAAVEEASSSFSNKKQHEGRWYYRREE